MGAATKLWGATAASGDTATLGRTPDVGTASDVAHAARRTAGVPSFLESARHQGVARPWLYGLAWLGLVYLVVMVGVYFLWR